MAKRIITKIGDVFCTEFGNGTKGYFQYIAKDRTQLNSPVIRAFKTHYPINKELSTDDIVNDEIDFYAHTILRPGIAENGWYKVGKSANIGDNEIQNVIFGNSLIHGGFCKKERYEKKISPLEKWIVWHINENPVRIGKLPEKYHDIVEFGYVMNYLNIIYRMKSGYYPITSIMFDILKRTPRPEYMSYVKYIDEEVEFYLCFKGNFFDKAVLIKLKNGNVTKITRDEAVINQKPIARAKFSDANWLNENFITEEEFNQVWNRY